MTLVLETSTGINPQTDSAIQAVLKMHSAREQSAPQSFGSDQFSYFEIEQSQDVDHLIQELMKINGVVAAYTKPMGSPPM